MIRRLLSTPDSKLGRAGRFIVIQIKLWSHCIRLLHKNRATQQAAALSYHTIFGIVPLGIVILLLFQSMPQHRDIGDRVKNFVYEQLNLTNIAYEQQDESTQGTQVVEPGERLMLTDHLDNIVDQFFASVDRGSLGLLSVVIVVFAAIGLLGTIERAFNNIWHVGRGRGFFQRVINYWALLTLGPLLLGAGIYITTQYSLIGRMKATVLANFAPAAIGYMIAVVAFFLLYFVLPHTRVKVPPAIWGAAIAALAWTGAKAIFSLYVLRLPYSKIYGAVGLIPLGVFWIYITWLIVLFGLQLTFTTQYLSVLDAAEIAAGKKDEEESFVANDLTAINIAREVAAAFRDNEGPVSPALVCSRLDIPGALGDKILNSLVEKGLLARTTEPQLGFVPAKDLENIRLSDIAEAVATTAFAQSTTRESAELDRVVADNRAILARYSLKQVLGEVGTRGKIRPRRRPQPKKPWVDRIRGIFRKRPKPLAEPETPVEDASQDKPLVADEPQAKRQQGDSAET